MFSHHFEHHSSSLPLSSYGIVAIAPFSHRLAFDGIPDEVQKLRCRVNFEALKFVPAISTLGHTIVQRLHHITDLSEVFVTKKDMAAKDNLDRALSFKYVALHLRFDKVSCSCHHGLQVTVACLPYSGVMSYSAVR